MPADPRRVVALDEYSAMNAYSLGIEPVAVFGSFGSEISATVLGEAGITVTPAPTLFQSPPIEQIAGLRPAS
ncbi:hypothetical protein BJF78_04300 [Pseudonocardia sp. CNS-139]|nr:hypothetical protein BJF78_04300 [Pseudonocardia sp. CNS-139]